MFSEVVSANTLDLEDTDIIAIPGLSSIEILPVHTSEFHFCRQDEEADETNWLE